MALLPWLGYKDATVGLSTLVVTGTANIYDLDGGTVTVIEGTGTTTWNRVMLADILDGETLKLIPSTGFAGLTNAAISTYFTNNPGSFLILSSAVGPQKDLIFPFSACIPDAGAFTSTSTPVSGGSPTTNLPYDFTASLDQLFVPFASPGWNLGTAYIGPGSAGQMLSQNFGVGSNGVSGNGDMSFALLRAGDSETGAGPVYRLALPSDISSGSFGTVSGALQYNYNGQQQLYYFSPDIPDFGPANGQGQNALDCLGVFGINGGPNVPGGTVIRRSTRIFDIICPNADDTMDSMVLIDAPGYNTSDPSANNPGYFQSVSPAPGSSAGFTLNNLFPLEVWGYPLANPPFQNTVQIADIYSGFSFSNAYSPAPFGSISSGYYISETYSVSAVLS
jgi:hypothetical protein